MKGEQGQERLSKRLNALDYIIWKQGEGGHDSLHGRPQSSHDPVAGLKMILLAHDEHPGLTTYLFFFHTKGEFEIEFLHVYVTYYKQSFL